MAPTLSKCFQLLFLTHSALALPQFTVHVPDASCLTPATTFTTYTALGDSYAAGLGSIPTGTLSVCNGTETTGCTTDLACLQNSGAYGYQLAQQGIFANFSFLACAGANSTTCNQDQVLTPAFGSPDLVSIHIGVNNGGAFESVVADCVYSQNALGNCDSALSNASASISGIDSYLDSLFSDISTTNLSSNPRSVVVMGYPTIYNISTPASSCQSPYIAWPSSGAGGYRNQINGLITALNTKLELASEKTGFIFVETDALFTGHRLCDDTSDPYFQYLPFDPTDMAEEMLFDAGEYVNPGVFHPTAEGQGIFLAGLKAGVPS